jgi:hypothetical protein
VLLCAHNVEMSADRVFNSVYSLGFVRVAVGIPWLRVADPRY